MLQWMNEFMKDEDGQGLVEYGFVIMLVAMVSVGVLYSLGETIRIGYRDHIEKPVEDALGSIGD